LILVFGIIVGHAAYFVRSNNTRSKHPSFRGSAIYSKTYVAIEYH
jgi:hypothetical protein